MSGNAALAAAKRRRNPVESLNANTRQDIHNVSQENYRQASYEQTEKGDNRFIHYK